MKDPRLGKARIVIGEPPKPKDKLCAWCHLPLRLSGGGGTSSYFVEPYEEGYGPGMWRFHGRCSNMFHSWGMMYFAQQLNRWHINGEPGLPKKEYKRIIQTLLKGWRDMFVEWSKSYKKLEEEYHNEED